VGCTFDQNDHLKRRAAHQKQVQRSVVSVRLEEAVESQQRCQKGSDPKDGGTDPGEQVEVGTDPERNKRHQDEEEHDAQRGAPADAAAHHEIAAKQCGEG
jgi:hypothetical protein